MRVLKDSHWANIVLWQQRPQVCQRGALLAKGWRQPRERWTCAAWICGVMEGAD